MKKSPRLLSIVFAIASIVCVIAGISLLAQKEIGSAVLALIFGASLGYFAYHYFRKQKETISTSSPSEPVATTSAVKTTQDVSIKSTDEIHSSLHSDNSSKQTPMPKFKGEMFAVAGVTFKNDNGTSRQRILRELYDNEGDGGFVDAELEEYLYEGRPAVRVNTVNGCIGNIRSADTSRVREILQNNNNVFVNLFPDKFKDSETGKTIYRADVSINYPNKD